MANNSAHDRSRRSRWDGMGWDGVQLAGRTAGGFAAGVRPSVRPRWMDGWLAGCLPGGVVEEVLPAGGRDEDSYR